MIERKNLVKIKIIVCIIFLLIQSSESFESDLANIEKIYVLLEMFYRDDINEKLNLYLSYKNIFS
jgi:hypothetical protein